MTKKLAFIKPCLDDKLARVGGAALIGGIVAWPATQDGHPLTLLMSLPTEFLNRNAGVSLPSGKIVSVFSYYAQDEYFLDCITYHGSQEELDWLRRGFTRVLLHPPGGVMSSAEELPPMELEIEDAHSTPADTYGGSKIGGTPTLLQAEPLALGDEKFALQVYGGSFPAGHRGVLGLSDAVGYLFINESKARNGELDVGTFFVQVT